MKTSVDWLYNELVIKNSDVLKFRQYLEQAKAMHKEEMKLIYSPVIMQNEDGKFYVKNFEQFYNETFK